VRPYDAVAMELRYIPEPNSGCWLWVGSADKLGYGRLIVGGRGGRSWLAHRYVYTLHRGSIPDGLVLDHLCRTPCCVNPWHLEPVTIAENLLRGRVGEFNAAKTHCPQGHEYNERNTKNYRRRDGQWMRICRRCKVDSQRRRRERQREAAA
jgi:hypothetical protein